MSIEAMATVLHHSKATGTDKLVLLGIANHAGDGGAWPSTSTLARYGNCSERQVRYSVKKLVALGELEVDYQAGGNDKTRPDRKPNLFHIRVACPPACRGGTTHGERAEAEFTPTANGGKPTSEREEAHFRNGRKPTSPEPSLEPSGKRKRPRTAIPNGWQPSASLAAELSAEHPALDLQYEAKKFVSYHGGLGNTFANHDMAFRNWCLKSRPSPVRQAKTDGIGTGGVY